MSEIKFRARSGNVAIISQLAAGIGSLALDASWDRSPSKKDMRECDEHLKALIPAVTVATSIKVEDSVDRVALAILFCSEPKGRA